MSWDSVESWFMYKKRNQYGIRITEMSFKKFYSLRLKLEVYKIYLCKFYCVSFSSLLGKTISTLEVGNFGDYVLRIGVTFRWLLICIGSAVKHFPRAQGKYLGLQSIICDKSNKIICRIHINLPHSFKHLFELVVESFIQNTYRM